MRRFLLPDDTRSVYLPIARSLPAGLGYRLDGDAVEASRIAPLLPLWLSLLMRVCGGDMPVWLIGLFNAAFRAAACVLLYRLTRRYFGERAARAAALLYLIDPWEWLWVGYVAK